MGKRIGRTAQERRYIGRLRLPAYGVKEASDLVGVHAGTVFTWFHGRPGETRPRAVPVLGGRKKGEQLSYLQLVQVAFVATARHMGVRLDRIRIAHDYLADRYEVEYPFAELEVMTDGTEVLQELEEAEGPWVNEFLVVPSRRGQLGWAEPIRARITQFDYAQIGESEIAVRWYPRGKDGLIVIDPQVQFGAPTVRDTGVPTWVVRARHEAGESLEDIKEDFGIADAAIRQALAFEGVPGVSASA